MCIWTYESAREHCAVFQDIIWNSQEEAQEYYLFSILGNKTEILMQVH